MGLRSLRRTRSPSSRVEMMNCSSFSKGLVLFEAVSPSVLARSARRAEMGKILVEP